MEKVLRFDRAFYKCYVGFSYAGGDDTGYIEFSIMRDGKSEGFTIKLDEWEEIDEFIKEQVTEHES